MRTKTCVSCLLVCTISIVAHAAVPYTVADADIDGSGRVDLGDLAILAQFWLQDVTTAVVNDECTGAIELTLDVPVAGDNVGATGEAMGNCSGAKDVWYAFTAPYDIWVDINLETDDPDQFDWTLSIWDGCGGSELACSDLYGNEYITAHYMSGGETIYIRAAGFSEMYPDEGEFIISVTPATF